MKVLQINTFGNLSTGRIAVDLYRTLRSVGGDGKVAFARNSVPSDVPFIKIGTLADVKMHALMTRMTDRAGFFSANATRKLLKEIDDYSPDIVHLHNLHGYYLHIGILFDYLKRKKIPVVWTLHDCWAFTGHCCYFSAAGCEKWKDGCYRCPQKVAYPASRLADSSAWNYRRKKELFSGLDMSLVTVSKWLEGLVKRSFLQDYPVRTIYNGIDLSVFRPTAGSFREKYGLKDKTVILGVASTWDTRKGLQDFLSLANTLGEEYKIVLVGLNQKELSAVSRFKNVLGLPRTDSAEKLAEIYTAADLFFNASVEESFGLPTLESLACGTPVVVYNATALPEIVDKDCGFAVNPHDIFAVREIIMQKKYAALRAENCLQRAGTYEKNGQYGEYVTLYRGIISQRENR